MIYINRERARQEEGEKRVREAESKLVKMFRCRQPNRHSNLVVASLLIKEKVKEKYLIGCSLSSYESLYQESFLENLSFI